MTSVNRAHQDDRGRGSRGSGAGVGVRLPAAVHAFADRGPQWAAYVDRLPRLVRELTADWQLVVDGDPLHGAASLVLPVRRDGEPAVLKLAFPDEESEHEALGLQTWAGRGAVRLLAADPHRSALLLERLGSADLDSQPVLDACEVVAGLYGLLHVPAPARLQALASYVERSIEQLAGLTRGAPVPHRLVQQAVSLGRDLTQTDAEPALLVHGDLHGGNVLVADRADWIAIDPKPMSGDRHYEVAPMLWNRWAEIVAAHDPRIAVRIRFHTIVDVAGLDENRARGWVIVRMLQNALWELQDAQLERRTPDSDWLTRCVTVAKAVQD